MRNNLTMLALVLLAGCVKPRPEPPNLVDFTTNHPVGIVYDRLEGLSRRCFESTGLHTEGSIFEDTGAGEIDLKQQDGSVFLAINLKSLSPGQTAVKVTWPCCVEKAWLKSMQSYAEREDASCPSVGAGR